MTRFDKSFLKRWDGGRGELLLKYQRINYKSCLYLYRGRGDSFLYVSFLIFLFYFFFSLRFLFSMFLLCIVFVFINFNNYCKKRKWHWLWKPSCFSRDWSNLNLQSTFRFTVRKWWLKCSEADLWAHSFLSIKIKHSTENGKRKQKHAFLLNQYFLTHNLGGKQLTLWLCLMVAIFWTMFIDSSWNAVLDVQCAS